jgi:hypothetical protein
MAYSPAITKYHVVNEVFRNWLEATEPPLRWAIWLERPEIINLTERVSLLEDL